MTRKAREVVVTGARMVQALEASLQGAKSIPPPPPPPPPAPVPTRTRTPASTPAAPALVAPALPGARPKILAVMLQPETKGPASWSATLKIPRGARVLGAHVLPLKNLARGFWAVRVAVLVPDPEAEAVSIPFAVVREGDDATAATVMQYVSHFDVDGTWFHVFAGRL